MASKKVIGIVLSVLFVGSVGVRALVGTDTDGAEKKSGAESSAVAGGSDASAPPPRLGTGDPGRALGLDQGSGGGLPTIDPPSGSSQGEAPADGEGDAFTRYLPIFTEASFAALLGFALGYASRKILKLAMILLALLVAALLALDWLQIASVDWQRAMDLTNQLVLNVKRDLQIEEFLKDRIPAAGALIGGYFLGFRKG